MCRRLYSGGVSSLLPAWAAKGQKMIRSLVLAVLLVSSSAQAIRLDPALVSANVEDRRPGVSPVRLPQIAPTIAPTIVTTRLRPWPEPAVLDVWPGGVPRMLPPKGFAVRFAAAEH
jgi:hypothetical protein